MSTSLRCSRCGTAVVATSKKVLDGQTLCPSCYRKAIEEVKLAEQELEELLEYARELFGITEIPPDWLEQIKAYRKDKKTYFGMRATLYYYYEVVGNRADPDKGLWAIRNYYDTASRYFAEQKELRQSNTQVDLTPIKRTVIMSPPENPTRKPKYNIEDL